jgi:enoyl-CoA hydratase/carnithine racemase
VDKSHPTFWRATFSNPPINLFPPETFAALRLLMDDLETDKDVRVIVFDSDIPDYFIAHFDMEKGFTVPDMPGAAKVAEDWHNYVLRLARVPVISVAKIRGRVRGVGSEFIQACDIRYASEKALFCQPEVGVGLIPGGGGLEWLPRLVGRSRALEITVGSADFDAKTAELYGWINRFVEDTQLDDFVEEFVQRVAGMDKRPLAATKEIINDRSGLPAEVDIRASQAVFLESIQWPGTERRLRIARERGLQKVGEMELNLGYHVTNLPGEIDKPDLELLK